MTRAERRRQARMQEKCQVPLNLNLTVTQVAGFYIANIPEKDGTADNRNCNRRCDQRSLGKTGTCRGLYYRNQYNYFSVCD